MSEITVTSRYGQFDGLRENKEECINIRVSKLNDPKQIRFTTGESKTKIIRLLIDIKPTNEEEFMQYLNRLSEQNPNVEFHINIEFDEYFDYAKSIMSKVNFKNKSITLWPDGKLRNRDHLDLTNLNCNTIIPLQYIMWHNKIENANAKYLYFLRKDTETKDGSLPFSPEYTFKEDGTTSQFVSSLYTLRDALYLKKVTYNILNTELKELVNCNLAPDQKVLVLMKYFVDNYTYTASPVLKTITVHDTKFPHQASQCLLYKQGVCEGIAEAFMILLNNPLIQIDSRCLVGLSDSKDPDSAHAWNIVRLVDEKTNVTYSFYMDPTWNINAKSYYDWSFFDVSELNERKIYDCANPSYTSYNNITLNKNVLSYRLNDALTRIEDKKNGRSTTRIRYSMQEITEKFGKSSLRF